MYKYVKKRRSKKNKMGRGGNIPTPIHKSI